MRLKASASASPATAPASAARSRMRVWKAVSSAPGSSAMPIVDSHWLRWARSAAPRLPWGGGGGGGGGSGLGPHGPLGAGGGAGRGEGPPAGGPLGRGPAAAEVDVVGMGADGQRPARNGEIDADRTAGGGS